MLKSWICLIFVLVGSVGTVSVSLVVAHSLSLLGDIPGFMNNQHVSCEIQLR